MEIPQLKWKFCTQKMKIFPVPWTVGFFCDFLCYIGQFCAIPQCHAQVEILRSQNRRILDGLDIPCFYWLIVSP